MNASILPGQIWIKSCGSSTFPCLPWNPRIPFGRFDFLGITLQYEMAYTNVLQILDLSRIPLYAKDRTWDDPIVIGGGPCATNPEPLADFFDLFYIGEGETSYFALLDALQGLQSSRGEPCTIPGACGGNPGNLCAFVL